MKPKHRKATNTPSEHKTLPILYSKVLDEDLGIVEEIVAVFGNIDHGKDRIMPGAFKKTIQEGLGNILVLNQHNTDSIFSTLGVPTALREITRQELPDEIRAKFPDASGGLLATTQYLMDTPEGKGAFARIKAGAVKQRSIGFDPQDMDYETVRAVKTTTGWELRKGGDETVIRNLRTIKLAEYSPVLWGMNEATTTVGVKSADGDEEDVEPTDAKEMTPDGPVRRMGDMLVGNMHSMIGMVVGDWLSSGKISLEEHGNLMDSFQMAMDGFVMAVDKEVSGRELPSPMFLFGRMGNTVTVIKGDDETIVPEVKAGRMISTANAASLLSAFQELEAVLRKAGIIDNDADEADEDEKAAEPIETPPPSQPAPVETLDGKEGAGPEAIPPTPDIAYVQTRLAQVQKLNIGG